jgi:hypothetical protein
MGENVDYYMHFQAWPVYYKYDPIPYLSFPSHKANCIPLIVILASYTLVHLLSPLFKSEYLSFEHGTHF